MNALRAATLGVVDVEATAERYARLFDYRVVERGTVAAELAGLWQTPALRGRQQVVLGPASGAEVFIRLVQAAPAPGYRPLRTHGWAALELCVQDVLAMHERLQGGPFEIIGPPRAVSGLPAIHPMQVQGPDGEIVYLTEIKQGGPGSGLPTARSAVDTLFITVAACSDMAASARWFAHQLGLSVAPEVEIPYRMLARAFDLPPTQLHRLTTASFDGDICLELDQYPAAANARAGVPGELPPGIGLCTFALPSLDRVPGPWLSPPAVQAGAVYGGGRAGTLLGPDGLVVELVEAAA
jgi:catechol 2,3-dioxygenase-like lactoylglutathione lyase family enzyme